MAELIIRRKKEVTNAMLSIGIFINDKKLGSIASGETKKWEVEAGNYTLRAKGGLILKSLNIPLNMTKGDVKAFSLGSFGNGYVKTFLQLKEIE